MFHFDKKNTFCISLLSNNDRCTKMAQRFKLLNLDATIFPAVSNTNELTDEFANYLCDKYKFCGQSHVNVWKHIVEKNLEYALILEDDACFDLKWKEKLDRFSYEINDQYLDALFLNASEPLSTTNTWQVAREQYLTGGYILTLKGAKKLLELFSHCFHASDWMTTRLQLFNHSYTFFPWLIIQEGNETTIGSNIIEDHKKVLRCLNDISYDLSNYLI